MVLHLMTMPPQSGPVLADDVVPAQGAPVEGAAPGLAQFADLVEIPDEALPVSDGTEEGEPLVAEQAIPVPLHERAPEPQPPAQEHAEYWLLSMLGQRQVSVQARDAALEREAEGLAASAAGEANGLAGMLARLPVRPAAAVGAAAEKAPASAQEQVASAGDEPLVAYGLSAGLTEGPRFSPAVLESAAVSTVAPVGVLAGQPAEAALPSMAAVPSGQKPALEFQLKLEAPEAKWGEQMLGALRDSVELQLQQKVQSATIRLDPPELGSLEITLSHEAGRLNVQISAAQGDVARLLQQSSERLRQELVGQNFLQVSVQVSADGQSGQQQHSRARPYLPEAPVAANVAPDEGETASQQSPGARDVLITV